MKRSRIQPCGPTGAARAARLVALLLSVLALVGGCGNGGSAPGDARGGERVGQAADAIAISGPSGWTTSGAVTGAGTSGCCGTYTAPGGATSPIMFHMAPSATTTASASITVSSLSPGSVYTVAVKIKGNHASVPPTLEVYGTTAQIVKAHSYMDTSDENQWRERSFIVYTNASSTSLSLRLSVYQNSLGATGDFALPRVTAGLPSVPAPEVGQAAFTATPAWPAAPTAGQNLIQDSSFALATGTPWVLDSGTPIGTSTPRVLTLDGTTVTGRAQQILSMWLPPSTTYILQVNAGVSAGMGTIYGTYDDGTAMVPTGTTLSVVNVVTGTPTVASLPLHTYTFTTHARYGQLKLFFEMWHGSGKLFIAKPTLNANGHEWTATPWTTPPSTTTTLTEYFTSGVDPNVWLIPDKAWGGTNGGVYHTNVHRGAGGTGLALDAHGDSYSPDAAHAHDPHGGTRVGAAIVTRNYYASGLYEVRAMVPNQLGTCTAFWPFHYMGLSPGDAAYWAEPSPIRNTEIDWEMPGDTVDTAGVHSPISFGIQRLNNWGGQWGGEGGENSMRHSGASVADGNYHTFGIRWKSGNDASSGTTRTAGSIEWYIDGASVGLFHGATFGQDNVPFRAARFWVGIWFPAAGYTRTMAGATSGSTVSVTSTGWTGDPTFNAAQLKIQWIKITPDTTQNRDRWVSETNPGSFYATPDLYP
jgi:hypothetical protein